MFKGNFKCYCFFHFFYTYIYVCFLLLSGMCLMFSWGYYICAADMCMGLLHVF